MNFEPENIITDLQEAIRGQCTSDPWFAGIDIFTPDDVSQEGEARTPSDIEQRIEQSLSPLSKGICIIIVLPVIGSVAPDSPGIYSDSIPLVIRIVENPLVNRGDNGTRKTSSMTAIRIMRRLQHFTYRECLVTIKSAKRVPDENALVWDIQAQTSLNIPELQ